MTIALSLIAGLILLVFGGDALVKGAVHIAERFKLSPLVIGIVLVGFGTSTPELVTSLIAAFDGSPGIAIGNIVGSNIANILLILGATAIISPIAIRKGRGFRQDSIFLIASALLLLVSCYTGFLQAWLGLILILCLAFYVILAFRRGDDQPGDDQVIEQEFGAPDRPVWKEIAYFVGGLVATMVGAKLLVTGAVTLARDWGVSETIIGLTIVAVGTSLPELVASIMAALRKHADIAYGNIVGSNIYNILGILGVTSIIHPIAIPPDILQVDIWVMIAATILLLLFVVSGWVLNRAKGFALLAGYTVYAAYLASVA